MSESVGSVPSLGRRQGRLATIKGAMPDTQARTALYEEAQKILQDELPIIYIYHQPWPFVLSGDGLRDALDPRDN